jgi:hypothetical protein
MDRRENRDFFDRAADEVRSWFGDDDADRRRHADVQNDPEHSYHYHNAGQGDPNPGVRREGGMGGGFRGSQAGMSSARDDHPDADYHSWRDARIAEFDRDYDEYRRHRQSQFHKEFDDWRTDRTTQAGAVATGAQYATKIREHQDVLGSDGEKVGTVDKVEGDRIKLTKGEASEHRYIALTQVISVDNFVRLSVPAAEAFKPGGPGRGTSASF